MKKSGHIRTILTFALTIGMTFSLVTPAVASATEEKSTTDTAVLRNFISGLWELTGDNGLPAPESASMDRAINIGVDIDGNALTAIDEQDLRYYEGKYYLYGQSFIHGTFHYAGGTRNWPITPTSPESFYRYGGMDIYSSDDLMNWKLETTVFLQDDIGDIITIKKPRVVYSEKTGLYTMWHLREALVGVSGIPIASQRTRIAQSTSPTGPFKYIGRPYHATDPTGNAIGNDYEIVVAPDGTGYLVNSHNGVSVSRLNPEMTGIEETINIPVSTIAGGIGLHWRYDKNGQLWWYVTGSEGCGNCVSAGFHYIYAKDDPMGTWISPVDGKTTEEGQITPYTLAANVERSQVHSSKMLPDSDGNMHVLIPATHYRRDMAAPTASGDNSMALAGHFYFPLKYTADGKIYDLDLQDAEEFPLAKAVEYSVPPAYEAQLIITSNDIFYHSNSNKAENNGEYDAWFDETIQSNIRYVEQSWDIQAGEPLAAIMPAVFQRTPDYSQVGTSRPNAYIPAQDPFVNAPLVAKLELPGDITYEWEIAPQTVKWAPTQVALNLPEVFTGSGRATLTLSTEATNGGYGVAVGMKEGNERYRLRNSLYRTYNEAEGGWVDRPGVEFLMRISSEPLSAPVIKVQPKSLTVTEGNTIGFYVIADGVGLGYQWKKDGEIIYSANSALGSEASAPSFRMQDVTKADEGTYTVEVFNQVGSVTSVPVTLEVVDGHTLSGTVTVDIEGYSFGDSSLFSLNTVVKIFTITDGVIGDHPLAETLVRTDGRFKFETGYRGSAMDVDNFIPRKFVPGQYAVIISGIHDGEIFTTARHIEITDSDKTLELVVEKDDSINAVVDIQPTTWNANSKGGDKALTAKIEIASDDLMKDSIANITMVVNGRPISATEANITGKSITAKFDRQQANTALAGTNGVIEVEFFVYLNDGSVFIGRDLVQIIQ